MCHRPPGSSIVPPTAGTPDARNRYDANGSFGARVAGGRLQQQGGKLLIERALGFGDARFDLGAETRVEVIETLADDLCDRLEIPFSLLRRCGAEYSPRLERLRMVRKGEVLRDLAHGAI